MLQQMDEWKMKSDSDENAGFMEEQSEEGTAPDNDEDED